jgi:pimeloyl-ACP methyl ester carboxylesterase
MKVALLLPGYLDSPDYSHMLIFQERLQELGYLVERIDPCNLWATGDIANYSITNFLQQLKERVDYHSQQKPEELVLIGHSQGGMVAIIAGSTLPAVTKVVALCPPDKRTDSAHKWGETGIRISKRDLPENPDQIREFAVPYSFVEDAAKYSAAEAIKNLHKPTMIFISLEDTTVLPEITEKIVSNANNPHVIRQPGLGHDFRRSKEQTELVMAEIGKFLV